MDVHMHNSRTLHYGRNDGPKGFSEDDLQFLSLEERECILFFEETIGSLEEDDERTGLSSGHRLTVGRPASHTQTARHHSPVDHDIIDLVHPTPDPNKHKDTLPFTSDFQAAPETHYEVKAKRDPPQEVGHHPPSASTIIANKIVEHQSVTSASSLLQRRSSLDLPQNPSVKHGPPLHAKPTRLPDSISMLLGSREHIPHSIATEAVTVQERRALMLSNLSGSAHPLDGGEPACVRKLPTRSISFRDPTPDISRMEALSKLGLAQKRSQSIMHTSPRETEGIKTTTTFKTSLPANASADVRATDTTDHCQTKRSQSIIHASPRETESVKTTTTFKTSIPANTRQTDSAKTTTTFKTSLPANASPVARAMDTTDHCQTKSSPAPILTSAEVSHSDFNSYGGKSIKLNPSMSFRTEHVSSALPKTEASEVHLNNYGGRSRVMSTPEPIHGARSRTFFPVKEDDSSSNRTVKEDLPKRNASLCENRSNANPPIAAPRPLRHPSPLSPTGSRPLPKPSFRAQGITVQFSGRGATDEARRNALRKLGLLRDSS
ncbi:uncharacterized protein LOC130080092 [Rhinichthys klamathensis goyatoka]|uniref:uncharacterized protein LOC130080092 n=1 Tax=Rhinichthys klamathensis goyatoka TaxID=3034132 RepID=UPI0024B5777F|nr:uncharacterized protein LOC130080092 [Rhinichthys klamathensis goyatoka]